MLTFERGNINYLQINLAVAIDYTADQWIDLGTHTYGCMIQPETCGAAGGAISVWLKVIACPRTARILTSQLYQIRPITLSVDTRGFSIASGIFTGLL